MQFHRGGRASPFYLAPFKRNLVTFMALWFWLCKELRTPVFPVNHPEALLGRVTMAPAELGCSSTALSSAQGSTVPCVPRIRAHALSFSLEFLVLSLSFSMAGFKSFSLTSVELQMLTNSCVKLQTVHNIPLTINKEGKTFWVLLSHGAAAVKLSPCLILCFPLELLCSLLLQVAGILQYTLFSC